MSNEKFKIALEKHLEALDPAFPTAWENLNFKPTEAPFQVPTFLFAEPDDKGYRDVPYLQRGILTVTLAYPINRGSDVAQSKAEEVRNHFERGSSIDANGFTIIMERTPEITGGGVEGDRFIIRVRIRFFGYVDTASLPI